MARATVELHPEAREEFLAALAWYLKRSHDAAQRFSSEVDQAVALIRDAPQRWPSHLQGTRRLLLRRFPFSIIYLPEADRLFIVAVAHHKRRPGYWRPRLSP